MKPYLMIFNKEITDTDKLFGFQIMSKEQAKTFIKAIKKLEENVSEFEICGEYYEYSTADFEYQLISPTEVKMLAKMFEFDFDPSSGDSPAIGAMPNAIEQYYEEYPDEEENSNYDEYE